MVCEFLSISKKFLFETYKSSLNFIEPKIKVLSPILPLTTQDFKMIEFPPRDFPKILMIAAIALSLIAAAVSFCSGLFTLGILFIISAESLSLGKKYLEKYRELKKTGEAISLLRVQSDELKSQNASLTIQIEELSTNNSKFKESLQELESLLVTQKSELESSRKEFEDFKSSNELLKVANEQLRSQLEILAKITSDIKTSHQNLTLLIQEKAKISSAIEIETCQLEEVRKQIEEEVRKLEEVTKILRAEAETTPKLKQLIASLEQIIGSSLVQKPIDAQ